MKYQLPLGIGLRLFGRLISTQAQNNIPGIETNTEPAADTCQIRNKTIKAGDWRTLETYWNATGHAYFRAPANAQIKVRYGVGFLGKDRQKQTLDGSTVKSIEIGIWSVAYARIQIKVPQDTPISYLACSGGVARPLPEINF